MPTIDNILIVDDFQTMRKVVLNMLTKLGYANVMQAENGKQGWDLVQNHRFDLIISDYNMPDMTGTELLSMIREHDQYRNTKFIMLTAESCKDILLDSKKLNVDAYILKPFKIDVLQEKINACFN